MSKRSASAKRWDERHRAQNNAKAKRRRERQYQETRALLDELKRKPCADCGGTFDPICMDFDHRPGEVKKYNIAMLRGRVVLDAVRAEIAKCDLVCANCHRVRTKRRGTWDRKPRQAAPVAPQLTLTIDEESHGT